MKNPMHLFRGVYGVALSVALLWPAIACCSAVAMQGGGSSAPASITVAAETPHELLLFLTDKQGGHMSVHFMRPAPDAAWRRPSTDLLPQLGVRFGRTDLAFATPTRLRRQGISADEAVRGIDSQIASRPMTDVSIVGVPGGELAIALWRDDRISEIWVSGTLVNDVLLDPTLSGLSYAERSVELCCRQAPNPTPELGEPTQLPHPALVNCEAVFQSGDDADWALVCSCLNAACEFCFVHPTYCCGDPAMPPSDCPTPWLRVESENACALHTRGCGQAPGHAIDSDRAISYQLLGEIGDRLQIRIDLQEAAN